MKALLLLEPGDLDFNASLKGANLKEFDFEKYFYYGLTKKVWDEFKLREEVVERLMSGETGV